MNNATVIINTYNQGRQDWLKQAIDSYINQNNVDLHIIVSTVENDPCLSLLEQYNNIQVVLNKQPGIYTQLNEAIQHVSTDWFAYAAGDDVSLPNKICTEIDQCIQTGAKICCSAFHHTDSNLQTTSLYNVVSEYSLNRLYSGCYISDCSLIHKDILDEFMPFDVNVGNHAFWDLWIRVGKKYGKDVFCFNKTPTWLYRRHSEQNSNRTNSKHLLNEQQKHILYKKHNLT